MFRFDFATDDSDGDEKATASTPNEWDHNELNPESMQTVGEAGPADTCHELPFDTLVSHGSRLSTANLTYPHFEQLSSLPPIISYTTIPIPVEDDSPTLVLPRRDLFDAKFQLMASDDDVPVDDEATRFLNAPSDLVPGEYEGGFKTWECSVDLVSYLRRSNGAVGCEWLKGKHILEASLFLSVTSVRITRADDGVR